MYTYFFQSQNTKEYDLDISVYMLFMWPYFEDPIWSTFLTRRAISFKQSIGGHKWHYRRDIGLLPPPRAPRTRMIGQDDLAL